MIDFILFSHLILDMGGVFMFEMDRFGPEDNLPATYYSLGGKSLSEKEVNTIITNLVDDMYEKYQNPDFYDSFPSVSETLKTLACSKDLPQAELDLLAETFTFHELGNIPNKSVAILHQLAQTHSLALISNIWAPSFHFKQALKKAGIIELFDPLIFSSETSSIKPSPNLFQIPLSFWEIDPSEAVFIGDSLVQDIQGAQNCGMKTIWVNKDQKPNESDIQPDWEIRELGDLFVN